jgi:hypothetical protein
MRKKTLEELELELESDNTKEIKISSVCEGYLMIDSESEVWGLDKIQLPICAESL